MNLDSPLLSGSRAPHRAELIAALAIVILCSTNRSLRAQATDVGPGTRIRITASSVLTAADSSVLVAPRGGTFVGVVVAVDDRGVSVAVDRTPSVVTIPRTAIAKLERAEGRRSRARYAALGALFGGAAGMALGAATTSCGPNDWFCSRTLAAVAGGIVGAGGGAVTGAIVPPAERWKAVDASSLSNHPSELSGGGLALHRAQIRQDPALQPDPLLRDESWASRSRVGFIAVGGVRLPRDTRVCLDLSLQYRLLPSPAVGPFIPPASGAPAAATLHAFDARFSHWLIAFGPAVRF